MRQAFGRFQYPTPPSAVFGDDMVRHYQEFLDRRRAQRPESEYRRPTETEWSEFNEHFDKRRVELGSCGRPYGTPRTHAGLSLGSARRSDRRRQADPKRSAPVAGRHYPAGHGMLRLPAHALLRAHSPPTFAASEPVDACSSGCRLLSERRIS
ncbi:hypothetical protein BU198_31690 [Streptomyces sp. CBMA156]|nr:hypothetical protein [Streptomyces sp. CBMA156]